MTPQSLNLPGDILIVASTLIPCALIVLGMRGLYLEARRALLGRGKK